MMTAMMMMMILQRYIWGIQIMVAEAAELIGKYWQPLDQTEKFEPKSEYTVVHYYQ